MEKLVEVKDHMAETGKGLRSQNQSQHGRTGRRRKRKAKQSCIDRPAVIDADPMLIKLSQWLCRHGQTKPSTKLRPALFSSTGRGLQATVPVKTGEVLVSIPKSAMITCETVLCDALLNKALQASHLSFKAMEILSFFLLYHKYLGKNSDWHLYIDSLPTTYTVPAYCSAEEVDLLPEFLKTFTHKQNESVNECFVNIKTIVACSSYSLGYIFSPLCIEDVRWAWFTVNTRAVYLKNDNPSPLLVDEDVCALAPYLDLLNHSHTAQVTTGINQENSCYEITTHVPYDQFTQVFINYGPHDNIKLCIEYGFTLPSNPYSYVPVTLEEVLDAVHLVDGDSLRKSAVPEKTKLIYFHNIDKNLSVSRDGPSWNLEVVVTVYLMKPDELQQDWNFVYSSPHTVHHRCLVKKCLVHLFLSKAIHLRACMEKLSELTKCSDACMVTRQLVEECSSIFEEATAF